MNNQIQNNPLFPVIPEKTTFKLDGKPFGSVSKKAYLLYKPAGIITTRSDEKGRPTVFSLLKDTDTYLHAVGRLDMSTTGLLILTNDTKFSNWLTDPKNRILRSYVVTVRGRVTDKELNQLQQQAESVTLRKVSEKESHLIVELTEGKNREIRNMFQDIGHEVTRLKRTAFGGLMLGSLEPGKYRELSNEELNDAFPTFLL